MSRDSVHVLEESIRSVDPSSAIQVDVKEEGGASPRGKGRRGKPAGAAAEEAPWPSVGVVAFDDFSASYRPGVLPDALVAVTFTIGPHEKVCKLVLIYHSWHLYTR